MRQIHIVGMGCPKCRQMTADVERIVAQLGLEAEIGRIDDPHSFGAGKGGPDLSDALALDTNV